MADECVFFYCSGGAHAEINNRNIAEVKNGRVEKFKFKVTLKKLFLEVKVTILNIRKWTKLLGIQNKITL